MRLDKYLAHAGLGSRKEVKSFINRKRITVNNQLITDDGFSVNELGDIICFDGQKVSYQPYHYLLLNKPAGYLSATEDANCSTVLDLISDYGDFNLFPVGRLDKDTTGLLLLTNNGKLAHRLISPKHHIEKEYHVTVNHPLQEQLSTHFANRVTLEDGYKCLPAQLIIEDDFRARVIIIEGKFHQIKRMFAAYDYLVVGLTRLRMANLKLGDLPVGKFRLLTPEEISNLLMVLSS